MEEKKACQTQRERKERMSKKITLYKYMSLKGLKAFMNYHSIKLSFGYEANDRFEMLPGALTPPSSAHEREKATSAITKHGFISLTTVKDNPYMWGCYAEQYKGACLELSFEVDEKDEGRFRRLDKELPRCKRLLNIERIEFEGAYIYECEYEPSRIDKAIKDLRKCTKNIISNKHSTWTHEKEYRIVYSTSCGTGKLNALLHASEGPDGEIYSTADINRCAVSLRIGPLCPINVSDVRLAIAMDPVLRGIRIERAEFAPCVYAVREPQQEDDFLTSLEEKKREDLLKNGYSNNQYLGWNSFISLCKLGDIELLSGFYEKYSDEDVNRLDIYGSNGAAVAVRMRAKQCVDFLLKKGIKPIGLSKEERKSALFWCASVDFHDYLKELVGDPTIDLKAKDTKGRTALMEASRNGCKQSVYEILSCFPNTDISIDERDDEGRTALMLACLSKNPEVVQMLLDKGANVETQDNDGASALIFAASPYNLEHNDRRKEDANGATIIKMLLNSNANIKHRESSGHSALMYAAHAGFVTCVQELLSHDIAIKNLKAANGYTALMYAIKGSGVAKIVNLLLPDDMNLQEYIIANSDNETVLLSYLLYFDYSFDISFFSDRSPRIVSEMVSKILENGLNFLTLAARNAKVELLKNIRDYIGDLSIFNKADIVGCTPVIWSVRRNARLLNPVLSYLCEECGMDVLNQCDNSGCNVMMWAARLNDVPAIRYILDFITRDSKNPDIDCSHYLLQKDNSGMTAIMWAAWKGNDSVISTILKFLERYDPDKNIIIPVILNEIDCNNQTALDYACASHSVQAIDVLRDYDAKFDVGFL